MHEIVLNETEQRLFAELVQYNKLHGKKVTLRVAGGWVRDKLMGNECSDVDIAIDVVSGASFVRGFMKYLRKHREDVRGFYLIPLNHEKSKHLETASMKFHDYALDFVSLRTEKYAQTRIPSVSVGSPQEDAERRDLTINALFYNIETREVEDYTGRGMEDIKNHVIRTPLPPQQTFLDDPLRILRTLRFSAKYNFTIAEEIFKTLESPELVARLEQAVSRERIGMEIRKIIRHSGYRRAFEPIVKYRMAQAIFGIGPFQEKSVLAYIEEHRALLDKEEAWIDRRTLEDPLVALYSILCVTMGAVQGKSYQNVFIAGDRLRWTNEEKKRVEEVEKAVVQIRKFLGDRREKDPDPLRYREHLVRMIRTAGGSFSLSLLILSLFLKSSGSLEKASALWTIHADARDKKLLDCWSIPLPLKYKELKRLVNVPQERIRAMLEDSAVVSVAYELDPEKDKAEITRRLKEIYE
jgi:tRNA nucleotidyltransferase/poly(A) polymerase